MACAGVIDQGVCQEPKAPRNDALARLVNFDATIGNSSEIRPQIPRMDWLHPGVALPVLARQRERAKPYPMTAAAAQPNVSGYARPERLVRFRSQKLDGSVLDSFIETMFDIGRPDWTQAVLQLLLRSRRIPCIDKAMNTPNERLRDWRHPHRLLLLLFGTAQSNKRVRCRRG